MKNLILNVTLFAVILVSCDDTNPSLTQNTYHENSALFSEIPFIRTGEKVVIHRYYQAEDIEEIADDEYEENIYIEIPAGINEFNYSDNDLDQVNFGYYPLCFCVPVDSVALKSGNISGEKSGDNWKINVNVLMIPYYQYDADSSMAGNLITSEFSGTFTLSSN